MAKYTGRQIELLRKATLATYTGEEMEYFNKVQATKKEKDEPGFFGKVGLLAQASLNKVSEVKTDIATNITLALVRQNIRNKTEECLSKEMAIANLDILRKHGKISQEEYEATLEEMEEGL